MIRAVRTGLAVLAFLACLGLPSARAEEGAAAEKPRCPGVLAWYQAHPEQKAGAVVLRDRERVPGDPALADELARRVAQDQRARKLWLANPHQRSVALEVNAVDADDLRWLKALVRERGLPTAAQVGEAGVHAAWLLIQHADGDPAFQAEVLPALAQRHADGELDGNDLARLTDRVLLAQGRPQRYGTQFAQQDWHSAHFRLPDEVQTAGFDRRRAELGLMPLADYVCMMNRTFNPAP